VLGGGSCKSDVSREAHLLTAEAGAVLRAWMVSFAPLVMQWPPFVEELLNRLVGAV